MNKIDWMCETLTFAKACTWRNEVHVDGSGVSVRLIGLDNLGALSFDTDSARVKSTSYDRDAIYYYFLHEGWRLKIVLERGTMDTQEAWDRAIEAAS